MPYLPNYANDSMLSNYEFMGFSRRLSKNEPVCFASVPINYDMQVGESFAHLELNFLDSQD